MSDNIDFRALESAAEGNYKSWLAQLQVRFKEYLYRAQQQPTSPKQQQQPTSPTRGGNNVDETLLEMTRREIEVLAAYHCELQRLIGDQNQRIEAANTDLQETNDLAERLQVEVEKKSGGGISPRRQAKQQMRSEIASMRKQIDDTHQQLLQMQEELEGVRAEHADVRSFITKQFFPVARVQPDQKWRDNAKPETQQSQSGSGFVHKGKEFVVRQTKAAELREQMMMERRKGFVPGTTIRSTTYDIVKAPERSRGSRGGSVATATDAQEREKEMQQQQQFASSSSQRVKNLAPDGPLPHQLGSKAFVLKKVERRPKSPSSSSSSPARAGAGRAQSLSELSQERHARARTEGKPPFRGNSLHHTSETRGIMAHDDPGDYGE